MNTKHPQRRTPPQPLSPQRHRTPAAARPLIGDNVLSALRQALGWRKRPTSHALPARWGVRPLGTVHAVEDLVERVMGTSPLPRDDNDVTLLLVGLRRELLRLEQILEETATAPDLVSQARHIREEPLPEDRMPLVILTIRLAEIAQDLIDAVRVNAVPRRTDTQDPLSSEGQAVDGRQSTADPELNETETIPLAVLARRPTPGAARTGTSHRGSSPAAEAVSWSSCTTYRLGKRAQAIVLSGYGGQPDGQTGARPRCPHDQIQDHHSAITEGLA
ncbi:hypothetical protein [Streptomyces rhizosphaericus]|uniref:hypothetical protein n=1 Tax=Streptomyces rhizosphaericus TaxID=114699 RepID=UPI00117EFA52|nr:hypothetical protein [Streptomyces rhizosphaericus]